MRSGLRFFKSESGQAAIVFALIMQLAGGFLPELMQMHKGFIMRALVIVVVIGFIPQLVTALSSLGTAAGT